MTRSGIGVVINPLSRRHREGPERGDRLRRVLDSAGLVAEAGTPEELARVAEDFHRARIDVLAVSGGDGTTGFVLTEFERVYAEDPLPKVTLLRGGTMNTIANGIGVSRAKPEKLLSSLVERHTRGEELESSRGVALRVVTEGGEGRLGFLFGMGLGYGFLEEYYRRGDPHPTPADAAKTLAHLSASIVARGETAKRVAAPVPVSIRGDGVSWRDRAYLTVLAGTVPEIGLGFRPFFMMEEGVEGFHLVGVHGAPPLVVARLPKTRAGKPMGEDCAQDELLSRATFDCPDGTVRYFLDGDLHQADGQLTVEVGPRIRFVR